MPGKVNNILIFRNFSLNRLWPAFILGFLTSSPVFGVQQLENAQIFTNAILEKIHAAAQSPEWLALLFYADHMRGKTSVVDDPSFFLDPNGDTDPELELVATLSAFLQPVSTFDSPDQHPLCRYPARLDFIQKKFELTPGLFPRISCAQYDLWRKNLPIKGVSLVFAANYLNNPASLFGHTFLHLYRMQPENRKGGSELTDWALNFAANPTSSNPLIYSILGLTGGFKGTFSLMPYYIKIAEYNNFESRDLWEYYLDFSDSQIDLLLKSLWEIGPHYIDYYYFDENCSYVMLLILNIVHPQWQLGSGFPLVVTPSDTVKQLVSKNKKELRIFYRPSILKRFRYFLHGLDDNEGRSLNKILTVKDLTFLNTDTPQESRTRIIDAALEFIDFKEKAVLANELKDYAALRHDLLIARAHLPVGHEIDQNLAKEMSHSENPQFGPKSQHLGIFGLQDMKSKDGKLEWDVRFSLHDFGSPARGYGNNLEMIMVDFALRSSQKKGNLHLHRYTLFKVLSVPEYDNFVKPLSWHVNIGGSRELGTSEEMNHEIWGGMGYTLWPREDLSISWLATLGGRYSNENGLSDLVGIRHLVGFNIQENSKFSYELLPLWSIKEHRYFLQGNLIFAYLVKDKVEIRAFFNKSLHNEIGSGLRFFF